jgi:hypothetical protein
MKRISLLIPFAVLSLVPLQAQTQKSIDVDLAIGQRQGNLSAAFVHDWHLGKKQKFVLGVGGRANAYLGRDQYYVTAPAKLTSGKTGLGVLFTENIEANMDTFLMAKPSLFAVNAFVNLGYRFSDKFSAGFNIDVIGFSFGGSKAGNYINGSQGQTDSAKPTAFNLLLTSDNDLGSLNSELYGRYALNDRWALRGGVQFLFTEYTTSTNVQEVPELNDRFRNKSLMFMLGASFTLK